MGDQFNANKILHSAAIYIPNMKIARSLCIYLFVFIYLFITKLFKDYKV